jgi:hypothetical protein
VQGSASKKLWALTDVRTLSSSRQGRCENSAAL